MYSPAASIPPAYRQPVWGQLDRALKNSFRSSGILGLLILIAVFVVPKPADNQLSLDKMPERFARLIVEKPAPPIAAPPKPATLATPDVEEPAKVITPRQTTKPRPSTRRRTERPRVDPDAGRRGREMATAQVAASLDNVQGSLDKVLDNLSAALPAADAGSSKNGSRRRRSRSVRSGRDRTKLAAVGGVKTTDAAELSGGGLESQGISISAISGLGGDGAADGGPAGGNLEGGSEGGGGEYRSSASLLAVVRRYAAGIQFCYDNQLKREPGLRGKLVISLTVLANGEVSQADVVQNGLGSEAVVGCVLAQIEAWKFPAIPTGVVSFKTPFVFTPPE